MIHNPLHTTLNVLHDPDDCYEEHWKVGIEGTGQECLYKEIYLGPEGVAASTIFS